MWLFDIIKNGTLVDNQSYLVHQGILTNMRLGESISLNTKSKGQWNNLNNDESALWIFLNSVSREVEKTLNENKADTLILFNDEDYEHNTEGGFIGVTGTDARNFNLSTGNLIGFVKRGDYSLKISSRFGDAFLQYIIADADGFLELENIGGESHADGYEWLLAYLWNIKFRRAYRLGLPKTYITKNDRISRVRGTIDAVDYFRNKTSGKYLCSYREHSYDSPATSLFIKAYEAVEHYSFCQRTRNVYNAFLTANQGVKRSRQEILRTPYFTNPFYNDYNVLIDLSKQVISQRGSDFDSQHDSSAFFFDISMLFEYFIRKLIKRDGVRLFSKFEQRYEIPAGAPRNYMRKLEPDLVFESNGGLYVFDVKYKAFDRKFGVKREDLFQLHTYVGQYGNGASIKGCGFVYPISEELWASLKLDKTQGLISDTIRQQRQDIPFHVLFLKIPSASENSEALQSGSFVRMMSKSCSDFVSTFKRICGS
ncbi:restriction endonuclease [Sulfitobacter sp. JBTF-M27]|uniref:Restriction endonuclease n=1 Tax=Sulfitobacter sediminilitoris TaxID=2698830 RepID=A0A6P0CDA6_9RHOB|nr:restriction endonuclease [Sulfitobacter sediminilitoris]NEK24189.1 restriction endonuclease [Sulfitobacter sediminilitoris]